MIGALLLLNTTQRKLQMEENIYDSSNLLRALQLQHFAQVLSGHLHSDHPNSWQNYPRSSNQDYHSTGPALAARYTEDRQVLLQNERVHPRDDSDIVVEIEEIEDEFSDISRPSSPPASLTFGEFDARSIITDTELDDDEDRTLDLDMYGLDLESMPSLSRQVSQNSIPSLYHSDNDSEDDHHLDDSQHDAFHKLLTSRHSQASHPAYFILEKEADRSILYDSTRPSVI